jgi:DNA-binding CsgD family transcriptional regulator/pimeloyl-ACP methyl ester carboxylesterase
MSAMNRPYVQYARTKDGVRIAYTVAGQGPALVRVTQVRWNHAEAWWDVAPYRRMVEQFARGHVLVSYDARGTGLSDGAVEDFGLDAQMLDLEAVLDALGLWQCSLLGWQMGAPPAIAYAERYPERVRKLVLLNPFARGQDFLNVPEVRARETYREVDEAVWDEYRQIIAMSVVGRDRPELLSQLIGVLGRSITPRAVRLHAAQQDGVDVSACLPRIKAPALIVLSRQCPWLDLSHEVAALLPEARVLFMDGVTQFWLEEDVVDSISRFLLDGEALADEGGLEPVRLSAREVEVLRLVSEGRSNREIAAELTISVNTVLHHISSIFQKTGTANRAAAVSYAHRRKLL